MREVGDSFLRLSKRCSQFLNWHKMLESDFDSFNRVLSMNLEYVNNDDNSVRNIVFDANDH